MTLAEVIKKYRDEHSLSQRQFAHRCNLSNAQISLLEKGVGTSDKPFVPSYLTLTKIARGMGISTDTLFAMCDDFDMGLDDDEDDTPLVRGFISELRKTSPDEEMLLQAYRLIPASHRIEAMQAVLGIMQKYEN